MEGLSQHMSGGTKGNHGTLRVRIIEVSTEIRSEHLPNTCLQSCCYASPLGVEGTPCAYVGTENISVRFVKEDRLCGLVVRVLGYRSGGPGSIPGTTRKKNTGSGTGSAQPREYN
jgi:hypothetical protein